MIDLFNINNYVVDTSKFGSHLHGDIVDDFCAEFCRYVGAKHGCLLNSATNAIFLAMEGKNQKVMLPSVLPPVVANAVHNAGNTIEYTDNVDWVGWSYILHDFGDYKIIDSAQRVDRDQFSAEANWGDLGIFSFYPTKPVGSIDGGIIVSNDKEKIDHFKQRALNGMGFAKNNWDRVSSSYGWKMYMNSMQAFIAMSNLKKLDAKKERIAAIRSKYNGELYYSNKSDHLYRINVSDRYSVMEALKRRGISTGIHYKALHKDAFYKADQNLPLAESDGKTTLSIPMHEKMLDVDVEHVIKCLKNLNNF